MVVIALALAAGGMFADLSTLQCVSRKLDIGVRTQIEADARRNLNETGKRPTYDPKVSEGLKAAAAACAKDNKWTDAAANAGSMYTLAKIALPIAQKVLTDKGFDPAEIEAQFQSLPIEKRNRPLGTPDMQALVMLSVTDEAKQTRENAELLREYFLYLSTLEFAASQFSAG
jgi:hypothetical protein